MPLANSARSGKCHNSQQRDAAAASALPDAAGTAPCSAVCTKWAQIGPRQYIVTHRGIWLAAAYHRLFSYMLTRWHALPRPLSPHGPDHQHPRHACHREQLLPPPMAEGTMSPQQTCPLAQPLETPEAAAAGALAMVVEFPATMQQHMRVVAPAAMRPPGLCHCQGGPNTENNRHSAQATVPQ
jgi:hypothetical protein